MYNVDLISCEHPETGDRVRTTPKVFASIYEPQGYVEVLDDDKPPFVEVSPSGRPVSAAAKTAAARKAKKAPTPA